MPVNTLRCLMPICESPQDFEIVMLPDGTQVQRERQTKAQAKIQALRVKHRNEKLRQTLISLANAASNTTSTTLETLEVEASVTCQIKHNLPQTPPNNSMGNSNTLDNYSTDTNADGITAIQRQMIANSGSKKEWHKITQPTQKHQTKSTEVKFSKLKKLIFKSLIRKQD